MDDTTGGTGARAETADDLVALRREVAALRRDRMDRQAKLLIRPSVERAAITAEREVDALTSDEVERLRVRVHRAAAELQERWRTADSIRLRLARLEVNGFVVDELPHGSKLLDALEAEAAARARSGDTLTGTSSVRPPEPLDPVIPKLPRAGEMRRIVDDAREHLRQRDLQTKRPRVGKRDRRDVDAR